MTKDEMVGWHHRLNEHGSGETPGVGDEQRSGVLLFIGNYHNTVNWLSVQLSHSVVSNSL